MLGTRQGPARRSGRSILALSTLALLAFCCLPAPASASSAGYQYEDAPQTPTGKAPSESNLSGGSSTSGIGSAADDSKANGSGSGAANDANKGNRSSKDADRSGAGNSTGKDRSQGKGGSGGEEASAVPLSGSAPGTDDGGSPLVPILIAIAVLAAASIAYLVAKRRRAGDAGEAGSPASPKAG